MSDPATLVAAASALLTGVTGNAIYDWLKARFVQPHEQEALEAYRSSPESAAKRKRFSGNLEVLLEEHPELIAELERLVAADGGPLVQQNATVSGGSISVQVSGSHNQVSELDAS